MAAAIAMHLKCCLCLGLLRVDADAQRRGAHSLELHLHALQQDGLDAAGAPPRTQHMLHMHLRPLIQSHSSAGALQLHSEGPVSGLTNSPGMLVSWQCGARRRAPGQLQVWCSPRSCVSRNDLAYAQPPRQRYLHLRTGFSQAPVTNAMGAELGAAFADVNQRRPRAAWRLVRPRPVKGVCVHGVALRWRHRRRVRCVSNRPNAETHCALGRHVRGAHGESSPVHRPEDCRINGCPCAAASGIGVGTQEAQLLPRRVSSSLDDGGGTAQRDVASHACCSSVRTCPGLWTCNARAVTQWPRKQAQSI